MKSKFKKIKEGSIDTFIKYYRKIRENGVVQIMEYYDQGMIAAYKKQLELSEKARFKITRKILRSKLAPYLVLLLVSRSALILTIVLDQRAYLKKVFSRRNSPPSHEKEI